MKENAFLINDKTQDIRMMTDFRDEIERIKQKLAQDFSKYSEFEKMKNKQKVTGKAIIFRKSEDKYLRQTKNNNNSYFDKEHSTDEFNYKYEPQSFNNTISQINSKNNESNSLFEKEKDESINNINNNNKYKTNLKNLSSINMHNINPLNYNVSFRKKYVDISNEEEDEDLNFSFTNDLNKQRNITSANSQDTTKIINNNINININNNSSLILDSKLDQQIKFIDEKSENNRIEEEKTQKKIKQIENKLQLEERLTQRNKKKCFERID